MHFERMSRISRPISPIDRDTQHLKRLSIWGMFTNELNMIHVNSTCVRDVLQDMTSKDKIPLSTCRQLLRLKNILFPIMIQGYSSGPTINYGGRSFEFRIGTLSKEIYIFDLPLIKAQYSSENKINSARQVHIGKMHE